MPTSATSVKNARAYGRSEVRARNTGQSVRSRKQRAGDAQQLRVVE